MIVLFVYILIAVILAGAGVYLLKILPIDATFKTIGTVIIVVLFVIFMLLILLQAVPHLPPLGTR